MNTFKQIVVSAVVAGSITGSLFAIGQMAEASAQPCTVGQPYPSWNHNCTFYGGQCAVGLNCSPVANTPGTWNPSGYTPPVSPADLAPKY